MSTDRPDKTETAYTMDAGHFQMEMDLVTYGRDRHTTDESAGRELLDRAREREGRAD
jgi:hypothetical protein